MRQRRQKKAPKGDYPVGYCKPPDNAKWGPGQSGNPSGRPKVPPAIEDLFMEQAMKSVAVKSGDRVVNVSKMEAVVMGTLNKAAVGNPQLTKQVFEEYRRAQAVLAKRAQCPPERHFSWSEEQAELMREIEKIGRELDVEPDSDKSE